MAVGFPQSRDLRLQSPDVLFLTFTVGSIAAAVSNRRGGGREKDNL